MSFASCFLLLFTRIGPSYVLEDAQMRKEIELLKDHPHVAPQLFDLFEVAGQLDAVDHDAAALMGLEPVDAADERRLADPDGPQMTMRSPRSTASVMSRKTWRSPNHLLTPSIST